MAEVDLGKASWLNAPESFEIGPGGLSLTTPPNTDLWQRSYYGFRNDNAPALLWQQAGHFTLSVRCDFDYRQRFDQCGFLIYLDSENWFKASIEHEDGRIARLGSVVTNLGYSDWATTDIPATDHMYYRLSRRGPDFLIEYSVDGREYRQMRIFHLHRLGETDPLLAAQVLPQGEAPAIALGLYACSPMDSSFNARFSELRLEPCGWQGHGA